MASLPPPKSGEPAAAWPADATPTAPGARSAFWTREAALLVVNASERRRQAPGRFLISALIGLGAATVLDMPGLNAWLWTWLAFNVGAQLCEIAVLWRFRPGVTWPGALHTGLGVAATALVSAGFGSCTLILWRMPGLLGPAAAVLILGGSLLNVMTLAGGSSLALIAAATPPAALLVFGPMLSRVSLLNDPIYPALTLAEGVFVIAIGVAWRRTERTRRAEEDARRLAERRRAEAEAANAAKTRYAAAVSHEMRTPLTAILAAAAEGERRGSGEWGMESARLVGDAARMMRRLLDDLLDLAKIEAGHMGVETVVFSPRALLEELRRFWAAEAAGAHIALILEGAESVPMRAIGDATRLRQVLNNLVSNALKFTRKGEIRLTATVEPGADGGCKLVVVVADTGCGISAEQVGQLFTPFHQAHAPEAEVGGTGLGLAISRELARLMGGDITAVSSAQGSCFTVRIALAEAPAEREGAAAEIIADTTLPGIRLLVVDDQPLVRRAMGILLEPLGMVTEYAASGSDALVRLTHEPFDLVLMDVNMADLDGLQTTRCLRRSSGPNRDTPVLAVTGANHEGAEASYLASGMNGFIAKPLEPKPFYAALESALAHAEAA